MRLILSWLLCVLLAATASGESPLFTPGEPHASHLDYRQYFETMSAEVGACTLSIARDAYAEDTAAQLHAQVAADEAVLAALAPVQPHTVYVVKKPMAGMQHIDSAIYCTAAQMLDGSYRSWLAEAAFRAERWQGVGLAGYAFDTEVDEAALAAWYADDRHDDMLSLFPAYFVSAFATEQEMHMAEATAVSLMNYIIGKAGAEAAWTANPADWAQDWLTQLGIDRAYSDPYAGLLDGYAYTHNQFYPLIATSPKGNVFKLTPLETDMQTPRQVRQALCELEIGVDAILAGVQRDAPDWYPVLAKNYEAPITYECVDADGYSLTYHANRRITLGSATSIIHETAHMMTPCRVDRISRYMDQWKAEAIAEYLTLTYYPGLAEQEWLWEYLQDEFILAQEDSEFYEKVREIYLAHAPTPEVPQAVNVKLFWRADVIAAQALSVELYTVSSVYAGAGSASLDEVNGNELSYTEGEWLASYLINRHGLSAFLHYCMDEGVSFEEAFGMTYEQAKADWLENRTILE